VSSGAKEASLFQHRTDRLQDQAYLAMKLIRPSLIPKDMWQIIVDASADLEKRRAFQEQFEADVQKLQKPLYEARRVLQEIDVVLERIKRLR
jgi:hypothetical protein